MSFSGFPLKVQYTPLPQAFITSLLPQMDTLGEVRAALLAFHLLHQKRGFPRFITWGELSRDGARLGLPLEELKKGIAGAVARGLFLSLKVEKDGQEEELFFVNTEREQRTIERIRRGEIELGFIPRVEAVEAPLERPDIFRLYEENIGLLTPLIAQELEEAEKHYPAPWIEEAFKEAVSLNKRSWRYISRILEKWVREGKGYGEARGDSKEAIMAKYLEGRRKGLVQRGELGKFVQR